MPVYMPGYGMMPHAQASDPPRCVLHRAKFFSPCSMILPVLGEMAGLHVALSSCTRLRQ